jgi:hypothetical protein
MPKRHRILPVRHHLALEKMVLINALIVLKKQWKKHTFTKTFYKFKMLLDPSTN